MSMRIMQTNSYQPSQNAIKYTGNQNTIKHDNNQNNSKILISGMKTNKNQHTDTEKKQNSYEKMMEELKTAAEDYGKYMTDMLAHNSAAARKFADMIKSSTDEIEKIHEEKAQQNRQEQKVDDVKADKGAKTLAPASTNTISETAEQDFVEEMEQTAIFPQRVYASSEISHIDVKL